MYTAGQYGHSCTFQQGTAHEQSVCYLIPAFKFLKTLTRPTPNVIVMLLGDALSVAHVTCNVWAGKYMLPYIPGPPV